MADKSRIQWTEATWNAITGCDKVSPGCKFCYAEAYARRFWGERKFTDVRMHPERLVYPLRWRRPRMIFVNSLSDLFHEDVTNEFIAATFGVMAVASRHTFQVLTKRPGRMLEWFRWLERTEIPLVSECVHQASMAGVLESSGPNWWGNYSEQWPLPNVWLGVSVENQESANERIPLLEDAPAAVRFLSCEPLLGPIDLSEFLIPSSRRWVIVGGESGPDARLCRLEWVRDIVQQCRNAVVAVFVKQLGANAAEGHNPANSAPHLPVYSYIFEDGKGGDLEEFPEDLKIREFPYV